jgi:DUF971 family protein
MDAPEKIEIDEGTLVTLTWADRTSRLTAHDLREACSCADCLSDRGMRMKSAVLSGATPITIEHAELRGAYAINFTFGPDGHSTGIFTWTLLSGLGQSVG